MTETNVLEQYSEDIEGDPELMENILSKTLDGIRLRFAAE